MLYYVCVATEIKLYLPFLKQLIPDLVVLGMGMKWKGLIMKYELLTEYLDSLEDDDIVCFLDAYDVLPTKNIVHLENQFIQFSKKNPEVKIIVGYDKIEDNMILELISQEIFGTIDGDRINSGQYIGYVKNIKEIIKHILSNMTCSNPNDQTELTKYANQHKKHCHIDKDRLFFNVITCLLQPVTNKNTVCSFVHANGNGFLENFLQEHHNIEVNPLQKAINFIDNVQGFGGKFTLYGLENLLSQKT
jgi:hypothetical protein